LKSIAAGGVTQTYLYDYEGNLVQKNVGGQVTRYVYAGGPAPIAEINVTANTEKDFIQANGRTWGVMEATKNTYFHHDAIGSVVALSVDNGQVTDTYEYEPFGKVLCHQGNSQNDYQFVGGYGVRSFGGDKQFMGVRQYSEGTGRFTTQDPLGYGAGDVNLFRYSANGPLHLVDPTGNKFFTGTLDSSVTAGKVVYGGGIGTARIKDTVCGDTTIYSLLYGGFAYGAPIGKSSSGSFSFEGDSNQRSWSFSGLGETGYAAAGIFWGVSTPVVLVIPHVRGFVVIPGGWVSGNLEAGINLYITTWFVKEKNI
jgi:RHS repeat-associated protein